MSVQVENIRSNVIDTDDDDDESESSSTSQYTTTLMEYRERFADVLKVHYMSHFLQLPLDFLTSRRKNWSKR